MSYKQPPVEYQFKKGQVSNPKGRPKGKTMKEFAREFLLSMSDDEKVEWLKSLGKDIVWRMAEGNPSTKNEIEGNLNISGVDITLRNDGHDEHNGDNG